MMELREGEFERMSLAESNIVEGIRDALTRLSDLIAAVQKEEQLLFDGIRDGVEKNYAQVKKLKAELEEIVNNTLRYLFRAELALGKAISYLDILYNISAIGSSLEKSSFRMFELSSLEPQFDDDFETLLSSMTTKLKEGVDTVLDIVSRRVMLVPIDEAETLSRLKSLEEECDKLRGDLLLRTRNLGDTFAAIIVREIVEYLEDAVDSTLRLAGGLRWIIAK